MRAGNRGDIRRYRSASGLRAQQSTISGAHDPSTLRPSERTHPGRFAEFKRYATHVIDGEFRLTWRTPLLVTLATIQQATIRGPSAPYVLQRSDLNYRSPDPADENVAARVHTVVLAEGY